jgi:hypothetical protein
MVLIPLFSWQELGTSDPTLSSWSGGTRLTSLATKMPPTSWIGSVIPSLPFLLPWAHADQFRVVAATEKALIVVKGANYLPTNQVSLVVPSLLTSLPSLTRLDCEATSTSGGLSTFMTAGCSSSSLISSGSTRCPLPLPPLSLLDPRNGWPGVASLPIEIVCRHDLRHRQPSALEETC